MTKKIPSQKLYLQIAKKINQLIESEHYTPGTRLPPERDLALALGVSRPSVREALIALEIQGCVDIKMGSGVYVRQIQVNTAAPASSLGESPSELMQARVVLEGEIIAQACTRVTPKAIKALRKNIEQMKAELSKGRSALTFDRDFHLAIAAITGNSVMLRLTKELFDERHSPISTQFSLRSETLESWQAATKEHEVIIKALETGDSFFAQAAMRLHLKASEERWLLIGAKNWAGPPALEKDEG